MCVCQFNSNKFILENYSKKIVVCLIIVVAFRNRVRVMTVSKVESGVKTSSSSATLACDDDPFNRSSFGLRDVRHLHTVLVKKFNLSKIKGKRYTSHLLLM